MYKMFADDMVSLRKWEEGERTMQRPLLLADLVNCLNLTQVPHRDDSTNSDFDGYRAPSDSVHASFDVCGQACRADSLLTVDSSPEGLHIHFHHSSGSGHTTRNRIMEVK